MDDFPELKDGDQLEPWMLNVIYDELRRWRKLKGSGVVDVEGRKATTRRGSPWHGRRRSSSG